MTKVLVIVEDDVQMQMLIALNLSTDPRLEVVGTATTAAEAIEAAKRCDPELVILDHFINGDVMGLDAAPEIKRVAPHSKVLLFTSHDLAVEARQEPAIDAYLSKTRITDLLPVARDLLGLEPSAPVTAG
jgi:DNA-binding NarL/FixJ family response regulator